MLYNKDDLYQFCLQLHVVASSYVHAVQCVTKKRIPVAFQNHFNKHEPILVIYGKKNLRRVSKVHVYAYVACEF